MPEEGRGAGLRGRGLRGAASAKGGEVVVCSGRVAPRPAAAQHLRDSVPSPPLRPYLSGGSARPSPVRPVPVPGPAAALPSRRSRSGKHGAAPAAPLRTRGAAPRPGRRGRGAGSGPRRAGGGRAGRTKRSGCGGGGGRGGLYHRGVEGGATRRGWACPGAGGGGGRRVFAGSPVAGVQTGPTEQASTPPRPAHWGCGVRAEYGPARSTNWV